MMINPQAVQTAAGLSDFWKTVITAGAGLVGVLVGGSIQLGSAYFVARQQRKYRLADDRSERERADAKLAADRSYARAMLARHLEAYAKACADVMWKNGNVENDDELATGLPKFRQWPDVSWEILGASEMMKARDIKVRVDIQREGVNAGVEYVAATPGEARDYLSEGAARLGLEAWTLSQQMRAESGVEPFEFPPFVVNFAEALAKQVALLDRIERKRAEASAARRAAQIAAGEPEDISTVSKAIDSDVRRLFSCRHEPIGGAFGVVDPSPWIAAGLGGQPLKRFQARLRCAACGGENVSLEVWYQHERPDSAFAVISP